MPPSSALQSQIQIFDALFVISIPSLDALISFLALFVLTLITQRHAKLLVLTRHRAHRDRARWIRLARKLIVRPNRVAMGILSARYSICSPSTVYHSETDRWWASEHSRGITKLSSSVQYGYKWQYVGFRETDVAQQMWWFAHSPMASFQTHGEVIDQQHSSSQSDSGNTADDDGHCQMYQEEETNRKCSTNEGLGLNVHREVSCNNDGHVHHVGSLVWT